MSDRVTLDKRPSGGVRVEVRGLSRRFEKAGHRIEVLRQADLVVEPGEAVALVGQSGSGKSTFLHMLAALEPPTEGEIVVDGRVLGKLPRSELDRYRNRDVGLVFQFHHLLPDQSALDNAAMPALIGRIPRPLAQERARVLLTRVGMGHRLHHRPGELSGGEQQRVAIARALVMEPVLVLADEPTGNLDPQTADDVLGVLREIQKERGVTLIVVTHAMELARRFDRVLRWKDGKLVADLEPAVSAV